MNSNHVPTKMLLAYERYAAPLIFLGGRVYQNELLAWRHFCRKGDESTAEVPPTDIGFLLKRLFVFPTPVNENRQILYKVRDRLRSAPDRNSSLECEAVKTITAVFATEGPSNYEEEQDHIHHISSLRPADFNAAAGRARSVHHPTQ